MPDMPEWALVLESRIPRRILGRSSRRPCRFWFNPTQPPYLVIEALDERGKRSFDRALERINQNSHGANKFVTGGVKVDGDRFVFYGPGVGKGFMVKLAQYATAHVGRMPALAGLVDSGAFEVDVDVDDNDALANVDLAGQKILRRSKLWAEVLTPSTAATAELLANARPGEQLWFWMGPPRENAPMLIVQPIDWDPSLDRMGMLIAKAAVDPAAGVRGVAVPVDDGTIQLVSDGFNDAMFDFYADWVRSNVDAHPGLARLKRSELVRTEAGAVAEIFASDDAWTGVRDLTAPCTLDEARSVLEALAPEQDAWFWLTDIGVDGAPFFALSTVDGDPEGTDFDSRRDGLAQRFPKGTSVYGTVRKLGTGSLLFCTASATRSWKHAIGQLATTDGFTTLAGAKLIRLSGGKIVEALTL